MTLNGTEKSALLLMSIGPDQAAEILKHLTPFEIQKLTIAMVNTNHFSVETIMTVLHECCNISKNISTSICNTDNYFSTMLTKAMGEKRGINLLQEVLEARDVNMYLDALNFIDPHKVADLLSQEHPQIITTILMHLDKKQTAQVLTFFNHEKRSDIILRIANFTGIEKNSILELKKVINNLLEYKNLVFSNKGSIKIAANFLNQISEEFENSTIESMYKSDKELTSKILEERYLFENIIHLNDHYIQSIVKCIELEKLCVALRNTNQKIREKFYHNMSEENANQLRMDLEKKWYFSDIAIKNEQKLILLTLKNISNNKNKSAYELGNNNV